MSTTSSASPRKSAAEGDDGGGGIGGKKRRSWTLSRAETGLRGAERSSPGLGGRVTRWSGRRATSFTRRHRPEEDNAFLAFVLKYRPRDKTGWTDVESNGGR